MLRIVWAFFCCVLLTYQFPLEAMSWRKEAAIPFPGEAIGVKTFHYQDPARNRPVLVEFWYPTDQRQGTYEFSEESVWIHPKELRNVEIAKAKDSYPLIMMSHGNRGDRRERTWLVEALVKQGFLVASVEHHGNAWYHYNPLSSFCFWDRAKDITFALNSLLQDPSFEHLIDKKRIGFVGYSMGGMTGLALAGAQATESREIAREQCKQFGGTIPASVVEGLDFEEAEKNYEDPRIRAMLLICPAAFVYQPFALQKIKVPVGLIVSVDDEVLPYNEHAEKIIKNTAIRKLKVMKNKTSHYAFLNRITDRGNLILQKAFDVSTAHRWISIHEEATQFALQFFKETLIENQQ